MSWPRWRERVELRNSTRCFHCSCVISVTRHDGTMWQPFLRMCNRGWCVWSKVLLMRRCQWDVNKLRLEGHAMVVVLLPSDVILQFWAPLHEATKF